MKTHTSTVAYGLISCVALLGAAVPALAQPADEDIIVTGHYGHVPDSVQSLSQSVSYRDLDLSTGAGRDEFKHRLRLTSRFLCHKLGESDDNLGAIPSCRDAAYQDAVQRAGTVWEHVAPHDTAWVAGPAWAAPYPSDWATEYP